jgi:hypothetical protein
MVQKTLMTEAERLRAERCLGCPMVSFDGTWTSVFEIPNELLRKRHRSAKHSTEQLKNEI